MDRSTAILVTLAVFQGALLVLGWLAHRRTRDAADYYLGGRSLGPWVAALAANASSSSVWSLLGVSGFAYLHGLAALWLLPGCIGGFALNYFLVAARVRDQSGAALTMTELLAGPAGRSGRTAVVWLASLLTLGSLLTYVSAQLRGAGQSFAEVFGLSLASGTVLGAAVVLLYTCIGGYLAASITDTLQGLLMVGVAVFLPLAALAEVGGPAALLDGLQAVPKAAYLDPFRGASGFAAAGFALGLPGLLMVGVAMFPPLAELAEVGGPDAYLDPFRGASGFAAAGFALGLLGIGLGYPGQPHAINKYMGMAPGASLRVARWVGMSWAVLLYCGMVLLGLCGRLLVELPEGRHETVLYALNGHLHAPILEGIVVAAVLSAIMSTVDSQLLVCGSTVTHDLRLGARSQRSTLWVARLTVVVISAGALVAALLVDDTLFRHVLFAWSALGSAFGPVLLVHLLRGPVRPWWAFAAMALGGGLAIVTNRVTLFASGFDERVLAWAVCLLVAWLGSGRREAR